jgi:hypothetical protein
MLETKFEISLLDSDNDGNFIKSPILVCNSQYW